MDTIHSKSNGLSDIINKHLQEYFLAHENGMPAAGLYQRVIKEIERPLIMLTLHKVRGNQLKAAAILGLNRNTLRKKMYALSIPSIRLKNQKEIA